MLINYLLTIINGLLIGIFFVFLLRKISTRYHILVSKGMPLIGGIAIGLAFLVAYLMNFLLYGILPQEAKGIIISSFIMLAFGVIDDLKELSIWAKFFTQIIATALLVIFGLRTHIIYIGNLANIIITFIWVLGISNAFNHLDVIDSVSAGIALIICLAFFSICLLNGNIQNAILIIALSGAIISFLIYNFPPARIYLGNSGSHFLGFILAAIALSIRYSSFKKEVALFSPILILGFPIFDTAFLILMRMKKGQSAFKKSDDHLSLRFIKLGYSKNKSILLMLLLAVFFSSCGVLISQVPNIFGIIIIFFVVLVSLSLTKKMGRVLI